MASRTETKQKLVHLQQRLLLLRNVRDTDPSRMSALTGLRASNHVRLQSVFEPISGLAGTEQALRFFYEELYPLTISPWRDEQCLRVLPRMVSVMPEGATKVLLAAITLDLETEMFDRHVLAPTGVPLDAAAHLAHRRLQLQLVQQVGQGLIQVVRLPLMGSLLKCAKFPAKAKGLSQLHGFLTRGFEAFKAIEQPDLFMEHLVRLGDANLYPNAKCVENDRFIMKTD
ncbi:MAG: hypothetical protein LW629_07885 [Burkholderiales bacterium]|nr:hypothetical protein [Burkholderiales bacterium]